MNNFFKSKLRIDSDNSRGKGLRHILLAVFSFVFVLAFCYCTSPFSVDNSADAGFFFAVGQGMTKGFMPYRDYFDMKGPYLFLIEYIGQIISYGRWGIFIVEWLNLFLVAVLITEIFSVSGITNHKAELLMLIPCAWLACGTFRGGNLTEEFSLLPLFICMLLYFRYIRKSEKSESCGHSIWYGAVYGFCFGYLALIRITNAALICAIVLCVCIDLVKDKNWKNLFANGVMFILGIAAAFAPMMIYYYNKNLLGEMLNQVFVFGFAYSDEKGIFEHFIEVLKSPHHAILGAVPIVTVLCDKAKNYRKVLFAVTGSLATMAAICMGNSYFHYYTLMIPMIAYSEIIFFRDIMKYEGKDARKTAVLIFAAVALLAQSGRTFLTLTCSYEGIFEKESHISAKAEDVAQYIPEDERNSVYCYNADPCWYAYTNLVPCIKYCGWQDHYIELVPEIENEMMDIFENTPPKWLVLPIAKKEMPEFLENSVEEDYRLFYSNEKYGLYSLER